MSTSDDKRASRAEFASSWQYVIAHSGAARVLAMVAALCLSSAAQPTVSSGASATVLLRPANARSSDSAGAVWPWLVGNIDADTPQIIDDMLGAGLDTIYLHLWRTTGPGAGTLYMADESGTWNPSWGATQPLVTLSNFIARAHAANLAVVGVVNCFLSAGPLPGDGSHERLLLDVIDYLVDSSDSDGRPIYALDGLCLDRIRFYNGTTNPNQPVTDFVRDAKNEIGVLPLHAFVVASPFFIDGPPYDGSFHDYATAMSLVQGQFGQDWEALAKILDVLAPLAYIAEGGVYGTDYQLMGAYVGKATEFARTAIQRSSSPSTRLLPAVRNFDDSSGTTTVQSLTASIAGTVQGGAQGFTPWRYYTSLGNPALWSAIAQFTLPGADLPVADLSASSAGGNTVWLDAAGSTSTKQLEQTLWARFDLDGDGVADTPWSTNKQWSLLLPGPGPYPIGVEVRDGSGHIGARRRAVLSTSSSLTLENPGPLSLGAGGSLRLAINLGPGAAQMQFQVLLSLSESPAQPEDRSPPRPTTLRPDALTSAALTLAHQTPFTSLSGTLDGRGRAVFTFEVPAGLLPSGLSGRSLRLAALAGDLDGLAPQARTTSTLVSVSLVD